MQPKLLLIDDDVPFTEALVLSLQQASYDVEIAHDGLEGLRLLYASRPDLVILDLMMPRMDGWKTCERIREISDVPILMLTALGSEPDELRGLREGADLYMTKPFTVSVLVARIEALLRRSRLPSEQSRPKVVAVGELELDLSRQEATLAGQPLNLSPTEYRLLATLAARPGEVIPHRELLAQVWGPEYVDEDVYLKLYVLHLRQKMEKDPRRPRYIVTRRGLGYYLSDGRGTDGSPPPALAEQR